MKILDIDPKLTKILSLSGMLVMTVELQTPRLCPTP